MQLGQSRQGPRRWLGPLVLMIAVLWWTPEQLWSNRKVLFWACLVAGFLAVVLCGWCLYRLRRLVTDVVRAIYLQTAFRATQGYFGPR